MRRAVAAALFALCWTAVPADAIVVRHDAPPAFYSADPALAAALVDLPDSGHGVLVAPRWIVTVAHAVDGQADTLDKVVLGGRERAVAEIIVHPDFEQPPGPAPDGSIAPIMEGSAAMRDIALIRLAEPVTDIAPLAVHWGTVAPGETIALLGKGRGGTGLTGAAPYLPQRGLLRQASNRIERVEDRWLAYRFDAGEEATAAEGSIGAGDSGGPLLVRRDDGWRVAALASWTYWDGAPDAYVAGRYGLLTFHARLAGYRDWIAATTAGAVG